MIRKYLTILTFTVTFGPIPYQSGFKSVQEPVHDFTVDVNSAREKVKQTLKKQRNLVTFLHRDKPSCYSFN